MKENIKEKALNLMQSICLIHNLNHLSPKEIEKTLWKLFKHQNIDWHRDGSSLFSKEHIRIQSADISITPLEEIAWPVKVRKDLKDDNAII